MGDIVQGKFGKSELYQKPVVEFCEAITVSVFLASVFVFVLCDFFLSAWLYFVAPPWVKHDVWHRLYNNQYPNLCRFGSFADFDIAILNQTTSFFIFAEILFACLTLLLVYWPKILLADGMMTAGRRDTEEMFWLSRVFKASIVLANNGGVWPGHLFGDW